MVRWGAPRFVSLPPMGHVGMATATQDRATPSASAVHGNPPSTGTPHVIERARGMHGKGIKGRRAHVHAGGSPDAGGLPLDVGDRVGVVVATARARAKVAGLVQYVWGPPHVHGIRALVPGERQAPTGRPGMRASTLTNRVLCHTETYCTTQGSRRGLWRRPQNQELQHHSSYFAPFQGLL